MADTIVYRGKGIGAGTILFLIFLVLKLTGNITWSWIWVFSPLWIGAGLMLLSLIAIFIAYLLLE